MEFTSPMEKRKQLLDHLESRHQTLAIAESCTGGLICASLVMVPGASAVVAGGIVAYSPALKVTLLNLDPSLVTSQNIVSAATAQAMAIGVRRRLRADWGIATTGFAGPSGGNDRYPVHCAAIAVSGPDCIFSRMCHHESEMHHHESSPSAHSDTTRRQFMTQIEHDLVTSFLRLLQNQ